MYNNIDNSQQRCNECGLLHPYTPPGECPVAQGQEIEKSAEDLSSEKATLMMQAIQIKLLQRLKELPSDQQEELTQMVYQLLDAYE
jgi:hypothetical protein